MKPQPMVDKELHKILDQNMTMEIENRIKGNQKLWDAEIREIFRCLEDINLNIKEIIRVLLLRPGSS
jgi:hypothetical protein